MNYIIYDYYTFNFYFMWKWTRIDKPSNESTTAVSDTEKARTALRI